MKLIDIFEARYAFGVPDDFNEEWFKDMTSQWYYTRQLPGSYPEYLYHFRELFAQIHWETEAYEESYNDQMDYELDGPLQPDEDVMTDIEDAVVDSRNPNRVDPELLKRAKNESEWNLVVEWVVKRLWDDG